MVKNVYINIQYILCIVALTDRQTNIQTILCYLKKLRKQLSVLQFL